MSEITITKTEYELLTRQSEQIHIIERMILSCPYFSTDDIRALLGMSKQKEDE